ncbi:class I SAM-dependent methyltransferase [Elusimicrobiota bacterium]
MGGDKVRAAKDWWKGFFDPAFYTPAGEPQLKSAPKQAAFALRALGLRRGDSLLDLCCGPGRHSVLLARKGTQVTGLDYSAAYLLEARLKARKLGVPVRFIRGDMRALRFESEFDGVINLFTSFGYFRRQSDNLRVLKGVARALKPGGRFLIDVLNGDYLVRVFRPRDWMVMGKGYLLEQRQLSADKRRIATKWIRIFPDGRKMEKSHSLHLYDRKSLSGLLLKAGLRPERFWGGYKGTPLTRKSNRLIALARKPG